MKGNLLLARRQQCACLIQEIGSRLQTTQVVINAGIYYMHHFYEAFSPETIKPILVAIASLYIACKTEDFSRKLTMLIKVTYDIMGKPMPEEKNEMFSRIVSNVHALEATILMVIGFKTLEVKQPHVILVNAIRANSFPKEISHTSYYICTNMLHLTSLILHHSSEAIAASSLYVASKWNSTEIDCMRGEWFHSFSPDLTMSEIKNIAEKFTLAYQDCDLKIKEQLRHTLRSKKIDKNVREEQSLHKKVAHAEDAKSNSKSEKRTFDNFVKNDKAYDKYQQHGNKRPKYEKSCPDSTNNVPMSNVARQNGHNGNGHNDGNRVYYHNNHTSQNPPKSEFHDIF